MKKIGFIDLYISEWHANNYPKWIEEVSKHTGLDYKVCYAYAATEYSPVDNRTTNEWCAAFGIERCDSIAELCEKSDFIMILAPSNPEVHLDYVKEAFPCGKRCYIDKTFAPDYATAANIFTLGQKYGTQFFSTSALRYAIELQDYRNEKAISTKGNGSLFDEYIIHQVEMIVRTIGIGAQKVYAQQTENGDYLVQIVYGDNRSAHMTFGKAGFETTITRQDGTTVTLPIKSDFFKVLIEKILIFFETGTVDFDTRETLEVIGIREAAIAAKNQLNTWVEVPR